LKNIGVKPGKRGSKRIGAEKKPKVKRKGVEKTSVQEERQNLAMAKGLLGGDQGREKTADGTLACTWGRRRRTRRQKNGGVEGLEEGGRENMCIGLITKAPRQKKEIRSKRKAPFQIPRTCAKRGEERNEQNQQGGPGVRGAGKLKVGGRRGGDG